MVAKSSGSDVEGLGFAIPVNTAAEVAQQIIKTGGNVNSQTASGNAVIGVTVANLSSRELAQQYGFDTPGVYVSAISSINAQEAGFQIGDRIAKADGKKISDYEDLSSALKNHSPGDTISVVVVRDNQKVTLKTTLTAITGECGIFLKIDFKIKKSSICNPHTLLFIQTLFVFLSGNSLLLKSVSLALFRMSYYLSISNGLILSKKHTITYLFLPLTILRFQQ